MVKKKQSLGRDVFSGAPDGTKSQAIKKMLQSKVHQEPPAAKQVEVRIKLTPSNITHLDTLIAELDKAGKGQFTRDELIRVAITLLAVGDF